jgi:hypothetical protein
MTQAKELECAFGLSGVSKLMARAIIFGHALADVLRCHASGDGSINRLGIIGPLSPLSPTTKIVPEGVQFRGRLSIAPCSVGQFV